jgi:hypothetical protein
MNLAVRFVADSAVIVSVTMDLALRMLVRAFQTQSQPPERKPRKSCHSLIWRSCRRSDEQS